MPLSAGSRYTRTEHTYAADKAMLHPVALFSVQLPSVRQEMAAQDGSATHAARHAYSLKPTPSSMLLLPAPAQA